MKKKNMAQEYMEQPDKIEAMIGNKMAELERWRGIAVGITANSEGERVQSSGSQQKMADAIDRVIDLQAEINSLVDRLFDLSQEITGNIEKLSATEYDILHKRYFQKKSMREIGEAKGKSESWAKVNHRRALQNLTAILREGEEDARNT